MWKQQNSAQITDTESIESKHGSHSSREPKGQPYCMFSIWGWVQCTGPGSHVHLLIGARGNCSGWLLLHWEPLNWVNSILFPPEILPRAPEGKSQLHLTSHWPIYTSLSENETTGTCGVWRTRSWKYSAHADLHTLISLIKAQTETFNHLDSSKLWMHKKQNKQGIHLLSRGQEDKRILMLLLEPGNHAN